MKNKNLLFLFAIMMIYTTSYGQSIEGYVYDPAKEPAAFSTVVLMNQDSVFMKGSLIGTDGFFRFEKLDKGEYYIVVRNIEFNPYVSKRISIQREELIQLDTIYLQTNVNHLDEVVVKGEKALIEIHPDKMVYNVSASVNSTGNNALELISKSPGVRVDMDNNIQILGKSGVQVYINGRPSRVSGNDLTNILESMQSENIESLEIISNPSSKYDAEGTGGIINIVLKKDLDSGFNGSLNGSFVQGEKRRSNIGASVNYSGSKVNVFSSLNYMDNTYLFDLEELRVQNEYSYHLFSYQPTHQRGVNYSGGMDYKISKEHVLSLDARFQLNDRIRNSRSSTLIKDLNQVEEDVSLISEANDTGGNYNYNANLHYSFTPNRASEFTTDLSFGRYVNNRDTYQPNWYYTMDDELINSVLTQFDTDNRIDLFSAQADYRISFNKTTFSTGVKYSYINTTNTLEFYNIENNIPIINPDLSNDFEYLEKIAAVYAIFNWKPNDKWSVNAGLRVENTSSLGELVSANPGPDDVVPRDYTSLFPNISFSFDDKNKHSISLSYGRRITRPDYNSLNPFESRSSELSGWKGNPFLKPNFIDNYQLSYSFKNKLVISNTFSVTHDYFANVFLQDNEKGSILTPRNMDNAIVNGLSVNYPLSVFEWWKLSAFLTYTYEAYKGHIEEAEIDLDQHVVNLRLQNNLKLPLGVQMEITAMATSPFIWRGTIQIEKYYTIDAGLKKSFFNDSLLLQATATDIFDTGTTYHFSSDYGGIVIDGLAYFDGRRMAFTATYNFGNKNIKGRKSKSSLDKELQRISD